MSFCANDTFSRITCTNRSDFIIKGMNVTQMESIFTSMSQKTGAGDQNGPAFGGLNITTGTGVEIPEGSFLNPVDGTTFGGATYKNFTFIINISNDILVHIVGGRVDESQFANASNAKVNNTPSSEIAAQVGRFSATMVWADIASFIPSSVSYEYGVMQLAGSGYSKKMYCNGTTVSDPQCHKINQCNSTVFDVYNSTFAIPTNDACWLEASSTNNLFVNNYNFSKLASGFTLIFVDHFSGGLGGSDFSQINGTFNGALRNDINITTALNRINFTLEDINSTGLNLTLNYSINLSIYQGANKQLGKAEFSYINTSSSNLTCITSDIVSPQNTTSVTCNVTFAFSNGTWRVVITARDTSNNSNPINDSSSNITVTVDQIPPVLFYFNITNSSRINASGSDGGNDSYQLGLGDGVSRAQGDAVTGKIFAQANWTDNLTRPFEADLQFYNVTANSGVGAWQTINTTKDFVGNNITPSGTRTSGWSNFTFFIPRGHSEFEGNNISFRIIVNDTLGNVNNSASVRNITIQINDTTVPTVTINGTLSVNGTHITDTTPLISWAITEFSRLTSINVSVDSTLPPTSGGVQGCGQAAFYSNTFVGATNVEKHRNDSFEVSSADVDPTCPLMNGTHFVNITAVDIWGNRIIAGHTFNVQVGSVPTIDFMVLSNGLSAINKSNVTPFTTMNFSTVVGGTGILKNMSWTSSCNSDSNLFTNLTRIAPFNYSGCKGASANRTVTITVYDFAGNFNSSVFGFLVDDLGPSLAVTTPTDGFRGTQNISISLSAKDDSQRIDWFGYYLDNNYQITVLNLSGSIMGAAENITILNITNFTAGTHTIKFGVNDTLGNAVNSSPITFTATGSVHFGDINTTMFYYAAEVYGTNVTNVTISIKSGTGYEPVNGSNETSTNTFEILFTASNGNNTNISLRDINGSAVNWDKVKFAPEINRSSFVPGLQNNWTMTVLRSVWFNNSIEEFTNNNNNSYYGVVVFPINNSDRTPSGPEFWWIPNEDDLTIRTNISQCDVAFTRTTTTPCWNYTVGGKTIVQVPHFSTVVVVNDTTAPTITLSTPNPTTDNQTVGVFVPNITVSSDVVSCVYQANGSTPRGMTKSGTICLGQTESYKNLNGVVVGYNITFNSTDASGNVASFVFYLNVSDTTPPNTPNSSVTSSTPSSVTAIISISNVNETVNVTVFYGTVISSLTSTAMETDFNQSQSVSLSSLTASTLYHFNVSICDFNGNCIKNGTFNFTTSAAAAAAAATTTASSGASGGGGGAVSNEVASAARRWDTLDSGSSAVLAINNENIAVTGVMVDVANTVTNAEVKVASLTSNPLTTGAGGKVFQYLQLTKSNIADSDASKITINFRVLKSWLTSNGVAETDVVLYRYSDSKWNALLTAKTGDDANNVLYQSTTPGFSTFAIGTKEAAPAAPAPEAPSAEMPPEVPVEAPTAPPAEAPPAPEVKPGLSNTAIAWIVVGIIMIVAGVGYFMMQRRKTE